MNQFQTLNPAPVDTFGVLARHMVARMRPKRVRRVEPEDVGYYPRGGAAEIFERRDRLQEWVLDGPAGTGKTLGILWLFHIMLNNYPNSRAIILRKHQRSLTASALDTFRRFVLARESFGATYYGGSAGEPAKYRYPNGSEFVIGGMNNPTAVMSADYDGIYVNEATELTEPEWERLLTRRRLGVWPVQILAGDVNPQSPTHWINKRMERTPRMRILSRHTDNPRYWDAVANDWTQEGRDYVLNTLGHLTGVRRAQLLEGKWVAAEGQIYAAYDMATHRVDGEDPATIARLRPKFPTNPDDEPGTVAYYLGGIDWGWNNPGVLRVDAVTDDGAMYNVAEIYRTHEHVDPWWCDRAEELQREFNVRYWVADPSEPQNIQKMRDRGLDVRKAKNGIKPGIQAIQERLAPTDGGPPRYFFVDGALRYADEALINSHKPYTTEQEIGEYVWGKDKFGNPTDEPAPGNDHGMDTWRYQVAEVDVKGVDVETTSPVPVAPGDNLFSQAVVSSEWASPWD